MSDFFLRFVNIEKAFFLSANSFSFRIIHLISNSMQRTQCAINRLSTGHGAGFIDLVLRITQRFQLEFQTSEELSEGFEDASH